MKNKKDKNKNKDKGTGTGKTNNNKNCNKNTDKKETKTRQEPDQTQASKTNNNIFNNNNTIILTPGTWGMSRKASSWCSISTAASAWTSDDCSIRSPVSHDCPAEHTVGEQPDLRSRNAAARHLRDEEVGPKHDGEVVEGHLVGVTPILHLTQELAAPAIHCGQQFPPPPSSSLPSLVPYQRYCSVWALAHGRSRMSCWISSIPSLREEM